MVIEGTIPSSAGLSSSSSLVVASALAFASLIRLPQQKQELEEMARDVTSPVQPKQQQRQEGEDEEEGKRGGGQRLDLSMKELAEICTACER